MYNKGQQFTLKQDVTVGNDIFPKGSTAEIYNVVEDGLSPYNVKFIEKGVIHMAFSDKFIKENFEKKRNKCM